MGAVATQRSKKYGELLAHTQPAVIESEDENDRALAEVERLLLRGEENLTTEERQLLRLLALLIEDFEQRHYTLKAATPRDALRELMAARGIKASDLWHLFPSKGVASEVINGKRGISKVQAKALAGFFHVTVELFI